MDERDSKILCAVVQTYISMPAPVGSRLLAKKFSFNLSSATIRNVMADLEELGYLSQPHTSAGRVPTDRAYRFYVDHVCSVEEDEGFSEVLRGRLDSIRSDLGAMLDEATRTLASLTHNIGFAVPLKYEFTTLNRVQLFRYRGSHVAAVLLTNEGLIKSKVIANDFGLSQKELNGISEYLNSEFSGRALGSIRTEMVKQIWKERALCDILISRALSICKEALSFPSGDVIMSGISELIGLPDLSDRINEIAKAIEDKHMIVSLLDGLTASGGGVRVVIGAENPLAEMKHLSIVMAPYRQGDMMVGSVGMIGPTRMDYPRAIHMVDAMANFITVAITG